MGRIVPVTVRCAPFVGAEGLDAPQAGLTRIGHGLAAGIVFLARCGERCYNRGLAVVR